MAPLNDDFAFQAQKELWRVQSCLKEMESLSSESSFGDATTDAIVKLKTEVMSLR